MIEAGRRRLGAILVLLTALSVSLAGCSWVGGSGAAPATPTATSVPVTPTAGPAAPTSSSATPAAPLTAPGSGSPHAMTGTWVFTDRYTKENLRLHQAANGVITGDGDSAVIDTTGKTDHSQIAVHRGYKSGSTVTLTLFVTPIDWGTGVVVAEYLTCTQAASVLHCRMSIPLYTNVKNVPQDFYRRA